MAKSKEEVRKEFEESQKPFTPAPSTNDNNNKYSQDEVNNKIRNDLINWKDHLDAILNILMNISDRQLLKLK